MARIEEIKASTAVNVEAERKAAQLQDEVQGLVRTLKARDQNLQEATVKIELMDRRMEGLKKQTDTIVELEVELSKARKQERAYEEAMEQLQADLDTLEQDNVRLKAMAAPEKQSQSVLHGTPLYTHKLVSMNQQRLAISQWNLIIPLLRAALRRYISSNRSVFFVCYGSHFSNLTFLEDRGASWHSALLTDGEFLS